jgi:outer membrane murein-binding lipoprotein Lpp
MKFQKLIASALGAIIVCATLALGFQQDPLRSPNPIIVSREAQEKIDQPTDVKELQSRIQKLESKVEELERRIEEMRRPRVIQVK